MLIHKNEVNFLEPISRKLRILAAIVERYVSTGDPVGSKSVCEDLDLSFSSATIRSEMANLAEFGYLFQPHVSAGRIPSYQGYRLYINRLMSEKPLFEDEKNFINGVLSVSSIDPESLLETAAKVLAEITGYVVVITAPPNAESRVRDIQFVQIGRQSAMIVLMTSGGMIKNKLFKCGYDLNSDVLKMISNILKEKFCGEPLKSITPEFMDFLVGGNDELTMLLMPVIDVLMKAAEEACEPQIKIQGQKNLLSMSNLSSETLVDIFNFLENKDKIISLFNSVDRGMNFIIGDENRYNELHNASVVASQYNVAGKSGVIGVIGPTRMDYGKVSSQVRYVASVIGVLLAKMLQNY